MLNLIVIKDVVINLDKLDWVEFDTDNAKITLYFSNKMKKSICFFDPDNAVEGDWHKYCSALTNIASHCWDNKAKKDFNRPKNPFV